MNTKEGEIETESGVNEVMCLVRKLINYTVLKTQESRQVL